MDKIVFHADMDAFFASVEQICNPSLKGKPVIIGSDPEKGKGRGVVSAASYEARRYGVHSAQPISRAYRLCPNGIYLRPDMDKYSLFSHKVMEIFEKYTPDIEQISIDEAFLDMTRTAKLFGGSDESARKLKEEVFRTLGITVSIGIASNKSIAKIASDMNKPDGVTVCKPGTEANFLSELNISKLWGAGAKTVSYLNSLGFFKIGDIACRTQREMMSILGKNGGYLWELANGIDEREVYTGHDERKSISEEHTYRYDVDDALQLENRLRSIADAISRHLREKTIKARTVTLKLRHADFTGITRSYTFEQGTNDYKRIASTGVELFRNYYTVGTKVRLIGLGLSNFEADEEEGLLPFFCKEAENSPTEDLLDVMKNKYGEKIIRGSLL